MAKKERFGPNSKFPRSIATAQRLKIIVLGYIVRGPIGGLAWHHLQYVIGLSALGHDVLFVEDSNDYPSCYNPETHVTDSDPSYGLRFISDVFGRAGLAEQWAYFDAHRNSWRGPAAASVLDFARSADVLLNLSGVNPIRDFLAPIERRVFVDTDPVFTQIRHLTEPDAMRMAKRHTSFFSFGENFGKPDCLIPNDGLAWRPTRQPVVVDAWPMAEGPTDGAYSSVLQWDSYPARRYNGMEFGMKSQSFVDFIALPEQVAGRYELAIGNGPTDLLVRHGWKVRDALAVTKDPWIYQSYLCNSKAELSIAKHGYVVSRSGWFSERSANYMACGRPVIVQDTGFQTWLPVGEGVLAFRSIDEALSCIQDVETRYQRHCRTARDLVEEFFGAEKVLGKLLEDIFADAPSPVRGAAA
jgi:hypothetical protein